MNIEKIVKMEPITYVKIKGTEVLRSSLIEILEALEDTELCVSLIKIYDRKIKELLTQMGIVKSTIRGPFYCSNQKKRKALLKKVIGC